MSQAGDARTHEYSSQGGNLSISVKAVVVVVVVLSPESIAVVSGKSENNFDG